MERLVDIIAQQARQEQQLIEINESCKKIEECLLGNGKAGLVIRTDRLEQKEKIRGKLIWILISTVVVIVAHQIVEILGKLP